MRINIFLLFSFLCFHVNLLAQACLPNGITFNAQTQIDNFSIDYPGCTTIEGAVVISGGDINNLQGLQQLIHIEGDLMFLQVPNLLNLQGLNNLQEVGDSLSFLNCDGLINMQGLEALQSVGSDFMITYSRDFVDMTGLENLSYIGGSLVCFKNKAQLSMAGLSGISMIPGELELNQLEAFSDFNGLENLVSIGGDLSILDCIGLTNINALANLLSINGDLELKNLNNLNTITAFQQLTEVDNLSIENTGLENLQGLQNLTAVQGEFKLRNNAKLINCIGMEGLELVEGDFTVFNNGDLINFEGLGNLSVIEGAFRTSSNSSLQSMYGLDNLSQVLGLFLSITSNENLETLEGLEALETIGGYLRAASNENLISMAGINSLSELGTGLYVFNNQNLTTLPQLTNLNVLVGEVDIIDNPALINMQGLSTIEEIDGRLYLINNGGTTAGLESLKHISGNFWFEGASAESDFLPFISLETIGSRFFLVNSIGLTNLAGLEQLKSVGSVIFFDNPDLEHLDALAGLEQIEFEIDIHDNPNLVSIEGLGNIDLNPFPVSVFEVYDNPSLTYCAAPAICSIVADTWGNEEVYGNAFGCEDPIQILDVCAELDNTIQGNLILDADCDGTFGVGDFKMSRELIFNASGHTPITMSNTAGQFTIPLGFDTTLTFEAVDIPHFTKTPANYTDSLGLELENLIARDFWYCPDLSFADLEVNLTAFADPRPGYSHQYEICVNNLGSLPATATLKMFFEDNLSGQNTEIIYAYQDGAVLNGDTAIWNLMDVKPFDPNCYRVEVAVEDISGLLGKELTPRVVLEVIGDPVDNNPNDNSDSLRQVVKDAITPIEKIVDPVLVDTAIYQEGISLDYLIRFQNNNTTQVDRVQIQDTLSEDLNLSSFRMIAASHPYEISFLQNRVIQWSFEDVQLSASSTDELGSFGFIRFAVDPVTNLEAGDSIINYATVFMDSTSSFITNEAVTKIFVLEDIINDLGGISNSFDFMVFPNPSSGEVNIFCQNAIEKVELLDLNGVILQTINGQSILRNLPKGIFFIRVWVDGQFQVKRIVVLD